MNTTTTSNRWKKRLLLLSLMLVTGAGAMHVSKLKEDKSVDKSKTVAKKDGDKKSTDAKSGPRKDGGSAGGGAVGGGETILVADAGGPGHAIGGPRERRGGGDAGGAPQGSFDDRIFDMDGDNAPGAGTPGGTESKKTGSFEKGAGGGFGGGDKPGAGPGQGGGSDPQGGPGGSGPGRGPSGNAPALSGPGGGSAPVAPIASPIPEPETYLMLMMGLGVVGWVAKRRGKQSN
jgi:PEP-CTERM motif-containing protein